MKGRERKRGGESKKGKGCGCEEEGEGNSSINIVRSNPSQTEYVMWCPIQDGNLPYMANFGFLCQSSQLRSFFCSEIQY